MELIRIPSISVTSRRTLAVPPSPGTRTGSYSFHSERFRNSYGIFRNRYQSIFQPVVSPERSKWLAGEESAVLGRPACSSPLCKNQAYSSCEERTLIKGLPTCALLWSRGEASLCGQARSCASVLPKKRSSVVNRAVLAKKTLYQSQPSPYGRGAEGRFVQLIGRPGLPLPAV